MLGLGTSLVKGGKVGRAYVKDGLKLYMPYRGDNTTKGTQFVGTGSTSFDGDDDWIDCGTTLGDSLGDGYSGGLTISFWFKTNNFDDDGGLVAFSPMDGGGDDDSIVIRHSTSEIIFRTRGTGGAEDTSNIAFSTANTWTHVVAIYDGTKSANNQFLYVNGVLKETNSQDEALDLDGIKLVFGTYYNVGYKNLDGSLKNVAIWSRALTATEIQNVMYKQYAEVSGRLSNGLVSWWDLESDYLDSTDNDNNGTASGDPTQNADVYGGDTPVIPRAIDNAPTVQADAIGAGSALFDGSDDYIALPSLGSVPTALTVTFWVNADSWSTDTGGWIMDSNSLDVVIGTANATQMYFNRENVNHDRFTPPTAGQWVHVAATWTATDADALVYYDGVAQTNIGSDNYGTITTSNDHIGQRGNGTYSFDGNICQVGVWNSVLTQAQIQSIMEKTYEELTASEKTDLVSYWALDVDGSDSHGDNDGTLT